MNEDNTHAFPEDVREKDPNGLAANEPGAKLDSGKPIAAELFLGFPRAMSALVDVASFGAKKYSRHGFLSVENAETRYFDALTRHLLKHGAGEDLDQDSGLPHLWHALWNLAAMVELGQKKTKKKFTFQSTPWINEIHDREAIFYPDDPLPGFKAGSPEKPYFIQREINAINEETFGEYLRKNSDVITQIVQDAYDKRLEKGGPLPGKLPESKEITSFTDALNSAVQAVSDAMEKLEATKPVGCQHKIDETIKPWPDQKTDATRARCKECGEHFTVEEKPWTA